MGFKITFFILIVALLYYMTPKVLGAYTSVSNDVNVSASTGGNSGSSVTPGKASINVNVEQTINGVQTQNIIFSTTSASGEPLHYELNSSSTSSSSRTSIDIRADANSNVSGSKNLVPKSIKPQIRPKTKPFIATTTPEFKPAASMPKASFRSFFGNMFNSLSERAWGFINYAFSF